MAKITSFMIQEAYIKAKLVYENKMTQNHAISDLIEIKLNPSSASDLINNLKCMLDGKRYTRTNSALTTNIFLNNILRDFGKNILQNALYSLKRHIQYYENLQKTNMKTQREILNNFLKFANDPIKIIYANNVFSKPTNNDFIKTKADFIITSTPYDNNPNTKFFIFKLDGENILQLGEIKFVVIDQLDTYQFFKKNFSEKDYVDIQSSDFDYYSIGEDTIYYEKIKDILEDKSMHFFQSMNDIAVIEDLIENKNLNDIKYKNKIVHTSMAKSINKHAKNIVLNQEKNFNFKIEFKVNSFLKKHELTFNFKTDIFKGINNINLLIGENGVGKTQALLRIQNILKYFENNKKGGKLDIPFGNYLFLSNSPFSKFSKELTRTKNKKVSYSYIDLTSYSNYKKKLSSHLINILIYDIKNAYNDKKYFKIYKLLNIAKIATGEEINFKLNILGENKYILINNNFIFEDYLDIIKEFENDKQKISLELLNDSNDILSGLSSGQITFLVQIFSILDEIKINSLILIDEPELYLHPNLEIIFMRYFREILNEFRSYSIITTHSAVICREVPSEFILNIKKNEHNEPVVSKIPFETLSYDLNEIYNYVYDGVLEEKYYDKWLSDLIKNDLELNDEEFIIKYSKKFKKNIISKLLYLKKYHA